MKTVTYHMDSAGAVLFVDGEIVYDVSAGDLVATWLDREGGSYLVADEGDVLEREQERDLAEIAEAEAKEHYELESLGVNKTYDFEYTT